MAQLEDGFKIVERNYGLINDGKTNRTMTVCSVFFTEEDARTAMKDLIKKAEDEFHFDPLEYNRKANYDGNGVLWTKRGSDGDDYYTIYYTSCQILLVTEK